MVNVNIVILYFYLQRYNFLPYHYRLFKGARDILVIYKPFSIHLQLTDSTTLMNGYCPLSLHQNKFDKLDPYTTIFFYQVKLSFYPTIFSSGMTIHMTIYASTPEKAVNTVRRT